MIYTKDIVQGLKLKKFPYHNHWQEMAAWLHDTDAGFCQFDVSKLTSETWQPLIRRCDHIFMPGGACNNFVVACVGRGPNVRLGRLKLPGLHWKPGPQK